MNGSWINFCKNWLSDSPDILTVQDVRAITGFSKTAVQGWIDRGLIQAFLISREYKITKKSLLKFMSSSYFRDIRVKSKTLISKLSEFERMMNNDS